MRSVQILSFFFIVLVLLTSCSGYRKLSVNDYDMHYGQMNLERESENYYRDFTFYVNRDSDVYMLVAPQFVHQEDSVAITGILKEVRKDVIGVNLFETESTKILKENKFNRAHLFLINDSLQLSSGDVITITNHDVEKMTIYSLQTENDVDSMDTGKDSINPGKVGLLIVIGAAIFGIITYIALLNDLDF